MPDLYHPELRGYLDGLVPPRSLELQKMEKYAAEHSFPIIGPASGQFCYQVARQIAAKSVFELGSGYGYSTAWFCRAVKENGGGVVHHTVWDAELSGRAKRHLAAMGYGDIVNYHISEAVKCLKTVGGTYDLIFNDIDKTAYPESLPVIYEHLRVGGVLIVDNMLWSGRMFAGPDERQPETDAILELTHMVSKDPRWAASVVPIRDGLLMATKLA